MKPYIEISKPNLRSILPNSLNIDTPDQNGPQGKSTNQPDPRQQISFFLHILFVLSYSIAHRQSEGINEPRKMKETYRHIRDTIRIIP